MGKIAEGAFGKVFLVKFKRNGQIFAMKMVLKETLSASNVSNSVETAMVERDVLSKSRSPFVVNMKYSFQDKKAIYFIIDYVAGGQLYKYFSNDKVRRFNTKIARFYSAEVLMGLRHLHEDLNTMYRDLKPENILVEASGHIKLTDFGLSKMGKIKDDAMCGTTEFLAPETIESNN